MPTPNHADVKRVGGDRARINVGLLFGIAVLAGISGYLFPHYQNQQPAQRPVIAPPPGDDPKSYKDMFDLSAAIENSTVKSLTTTVTANDYEDARALLAKGMYPQAEPLFKRVLEARKKAFGHNSKEVAEVNLGLGVCINQQRRAMEAEPLFKQALAIYEKTEPNGVRVAGALSQLGQFYYRQGKGVKAEPLYKRALVIYAKNQIGPDDFRVRFIRLYLQRIKAQIK